MSDDQSPARSNSPNSDSPPGSPPYAGFRSPHPEGVSTATSGPSLSGWPRQIAWDEFRDIGSRPDGESEDAQISVELRPAEVTVERENGQFKLGNVVFRARVNRTESWVVTSQKNAVLLAHEQGHYDISGLFYRDLIAALRSLRANSTGELGRETNRLMAEYDKKADDLSAQYDSAQETNHGRNAARQQEWETQIRNCMQNGSPLTAPP